MSLFPQKSFGCSFFEFDLVFMGKIIHIVSQLLTVSPSLYNEQSCEKRSW